VLPTIQNVSRNLPKGRLVLPSNMKTSRRRPPPAENEKHLSNVRHSLSLEDYGGSRREARHFNRLMVGYRTPGASSFAQNSQLEDYNLAHEIPAFGLCFSGSPAMVPCTPKLPRSLEFVDGGLGRMLVGSDGAWP
jgi:hypothetical protein